MRKSAKVFMIFTMVFFLIGLSMTAIGWWNGFREFEIQSSEYRKDDIISVSERIEEEVTSVVVIAHAGTVIIQRGSTFAITGYSDPKCFRSTVDDGTWTIEIVEPHHLFGNSVGDFHIDANGVYLKTIRSTVRITIPYNVELEQLAIDSESGYVTMENATCTTLNLTMETGKMDIKVNPTKLAFISNKAGTLIADLDGAQKEYHISIESDLGHGKVGSYRVSPMSSNEYDGENETRILRADIGAGKTTVTFDKD